MVRENCRPSDSGKTDRRPRSRDDRGPRSHDPTITSSFARPMKIGSPCYVDVSPDEAFLCIVITQKRRSNKIYKTELTKIRYKIK